MTGTELQRKRSARILALLLLGLAIASAVGLALPFVLGWEDPVKPTIFLVGYAACGLVSLAGAYLELTRHPRGEIVALAAAVLGTPLTWSAINNAWVLFVPFFGLLVLGVFLSLAYRFAVRSDERHQSRRSLGA